MREEDEGADGEELLRLSDPIFPSNEDDDEDSRWAAIIGTPSDDDEDDPDDHAGGGGEPPSEARSGSEQIGEAQSAGEADDGSDENEPMASPDSAQLEPAEIAADVPLIPPIEIPPLPDGPLLPTLAARVETLHASLDLLAVRVDALGASTSAFRTHLLDRLASYAEDVVRAGQASSADLDEYRRSTERTVTELRRGSTEAEQLLRSVVARLDESGGDLGDLTTKLRESVTRAEAVSATTEDLADRITTRLDSTADALLSRFDDAAAALTAESQSIKAAVAEEIGSLAAAVSSEAGVTRSAIAGDGVDGGESVVDDIVEALASLRADLASIDTSGLEEIKAELAVLHEAIVQPIGQDELHELASELREQVQGGPTAPSELDLTEMREIVDDLRRASRRLAGSTAEAAPAAALGTEELADLLHELQNRLDDPMPLEKIEHELTQLRRRVGLRAKAPISLDDDQLQAIAEAVSDRAAGVSLGENDIEAIAKAAGRARPGSVALDDEQVQRIAVAVVQHLEESLELVPDDS